MAETGKDKKSSSRRKRTKKEVVKKTYGTPEHTPRMISMMYLLGGAGIVKDNGPVTGQEYIFIPGRATPVDERDYGGLLARRTRPRTCCGGRSLPAQQVYGPV